MELRCCCRTASMFICPKPISLDRDDPRPAAPVDRAPPADHPSAASDCGRSRPLAGPTGRSARPGRQSLCGQPAGDAQPLPYPRDGHRTIAGSGPFVITPNHVSYLDPRPSRRRCRTAASRSSIGPAISTFSSPTRSPGFLLARCILFPSTKIIRQPRSQPPIGSCVRGACRSGFPKAGAPGWKAAAFPPGDRGIASEERRAGGTADICGAS